MSSYTKEGVGEIPSTLYAENQTYTTDIKNQIHSTSKDIKHSRSANQDQGHEDMEKFEAQSNPLDTSPISKEPTQDTIVTGLKFVGIFCSMLLSIFLIALDQTILATALPRIASEFDAFSKQGWVSSGFILTQTAFLLIWSQCLRIYPAKYILLFSVVIFEVGSIVCGACKSVDVLIFGRALSGVGAAGIFVSMFQVIAQIVPLERRPKLFGYFGGVFGVSSIVGPLIGGALTDKVSWRWCFYINVPVGAVTFVVVSILLKAAPPLGSDPTKRSYKDIINQTLKLDWIGAILVLAAVTSLVLGLQWGGNLKPWNDAAVIVCLVLSVVLAIVLIFWEIRVGEQAMVPTQIFKSVSIYSILVYAFFCRFSLLIFTYYIPIYYQAGKGHSATKSGVNILPLMLSVVFSVIIGGQLVGRIGRYWPFLFAAPFFLAVGSGLMYTVSESTSEIIIFYQILVGMGIGLSMQNSLLAMQAEFKDAVKLLAQSTGMASFAQYLGGTIGLAVAEAVFSSQLSKNIIKFAPSADSTIIKESPTFIWTELPSDQIPDVVHGYFKSLETVYLLGIPAAVISLIFVMFIKNINIKKEAEDKDKEKEKEKEDGGDGAEKKESESV